MPPGTIKAVSIGRAAAALLSSSTPVRIAAVFDRSFYLESRGAFACVLPASADNGPLHICIPDNEFPTGDLKRLQTGTTTVVRGERLLLGSGLALVWRDASLWEPGIRKPVGPSDIALARERVSTVLSRLENVDGLTQHYAAPGSRTQLDARVLASAIPGMNAASDWIHREAPDVQVPQAVRDLVGLGPGLTPSGDDFLAAVLVGLRCIGRVDHAQALGASIQDLAANATVPISGAYVLAAAHGQGSQRLHAMIDAALDARVDSNELHDAATVLAAIGHTSGWDALAGICAVLGLPATGG